MWLLYNLLLTLTAPLWAPWMVWRAGKRGEKPNWKERRGDYRDAIPVKGDRPRLWVHTVSVGEFVAAKPLLAELRNALPGHEIVLSVTTSSGHQTARESEPGLYDHLVYVPIDLPAFTLAAMRRVCPDALIVLETELWMNLFWAAKRLGVKTFVVNARLSDRSFPKAKKLRSFYAALLKLVDVVLAQSPTDAQRFEELGARAVEVAGNIKFDQAAQVAGNAEEWRNALGLPADRPVVVVGSIRAEEFAFLSRAVAELRTPVYVIAPRHLERVPELVAALLDAEFGGSAACASIAYRSKGETGDVIVLDTYGELDRVYSVADVAVVGGGFAKLGGQNPLQPLAQGIPVITGPYMHNFRDVVDLGVRGGALRVCRSERELIETLNDLLNSPERRGEMGTAAKLLVAENVGASRRMAGIIASKVGSPSG